MIFYRVLRKKIELSNNATGHPKGGGTYFNLGGGAKIKKGTIMSKRALTVHIIMQIIEPFTLA